MIEAVDPKVLQRIMKIGQFLRRLAKESNNTGIRKFLQRIEALIGQGVAVTLQVWQYQGQNCGVEIKTDKVVEDDIEREYGIILINNSGWLQTSFYEGRITEGPVEVTNQASARQLFTEMNAFIRAEWIKGIIEQFRQFDLPLECVEDFWESLDEELERSGLVLEIQPFCDAADWGFEIVISGGRFRLCLFYDKNSVVFSSVRRDQVIATRQIVRAQVGATKLLDDLLDQLIK